MERREKIFECINGQFPFYFTFQKNPCEFGFIKHGGFLGAIGAYLAGNQSKTVQQPDQGSK